MFANRISNTAFLVNHMRDKDVSLSGDEFAHLWSEPSFFDEFDRYRATVNPVDYLTLCLRSRFFLNQIEAFFRESPDFVFINLGAGFTSYPYLLPESVSSIEVDLPDVIQYKQQKAQQLVDQQKLPPRDVTYIETDLSKTGEVDLLMKALQNEVGQKLSFVLMEGLTYFLPMPAIQYLLNMIRNVQQPQSAVALAFINPLVEANLHFQKWIIFAKKHYGFAEDQHTFLEPGYLASIERYMMTELTSYGALERQFSETQYFQNEADYVPEFFTVLRKY